MGTVNQFISITKARGFCKKALATAKRKAKARARAKARRMASKVLCEDLGLKRVRGSVTGTVYYE